MNPLTKKEESYLKQMFAFYFAPIWQSFFTILYLVFFFYFAIFHSGKIFIALKFLFYTLGNSASLLGLSYLFWGVIFLISLIIPFSVSLYAILLFFEIWKGVWERNHKLLATLLLIVETPFVIVIMDEIIRIVASQNALQEFVTLNHLIIGRPW